MQKIKKICALIIGLSFCVAPIVQAKKSKVTETTIKAVISGALAAGCGYAAIKYLPKVIVSGQTGYGVILGESISPKAFSQLIQDSLLYGIGVAFMIMCVIKFGSISIDNVGKTLR